MEFYPGFQRKNKSYAVNGKIMLCTGVIFFAILIIVLCFHNYSSFFFRNRRRRYIQRRAQHLLSISTATPTAVAPNPKGLDPCILKMIPTFIYSTKATCFPPLDCAVCLSEFENDEEARVLPNCNHTFHVDCIDMWFYSHSNCPLCRAVVKPPEILEQPVAEDNEVNTCSVASSSSSSSSASALKLESCPMKTLELMEVEILVREDRLISVR